MTAEDGGPTWQDLGYLEKFVAGMIVAILWLFQPKHDPFPRINLCKCDCDCSCDE